jgi:hypothetical protein
MPYKKYKNNYGWCNYPFENDAAGYCFGYADAVDKGKSKEEILKMCNKKVTKNDIEDCKYLEAAGYKLGDYWCEFYKDKEEK